MPTRLHASMSRVPAGAVTLLPSTVMFTSGISVRASPGISGAMVECGQHRQLLHGGGLERAWPSFKVRFKFFPKLLDERDRGHGRGITQRAEGAAQHVFGEVLDVVDVALHSAAGM